MQDPTPPKPTQTFKWLKPLSVVILAVGFFLFALHLTIDNPWTHKLIREAINEKIEDQYGLVLSFQTLKVGVLPPGAEVYGLKVLEKKADKLLFEAASLRAILDPFSLMMGEFKIRALEGNELHYSHRLVKSEEDSEDLDLVWPPDFDLPVDQINLLNSNIEFVLEDPIDPNYTLRLKSAGTNLFLKMSSWADMTFQVLSNQIDLHYGKPHLIRTARLKADFSWQERELKSDNFELIGPGLNLRGEPSLKLLTRREVHKHLRAKTLTTNHLEKLILMIPFTAQDTDFSHLGRFLEIDGTSGRFQGKADLSVEIPLQGEDDPFWMIKGEGEVFDGKFSDFYLYDTKAAFAVTENRIQFREISLFQREQLLAKGGGAIEFDKALNYDFRVNFMGLKFIDLMKALKVRNFEFLDGALYGQSAAIKGQGSPFQLTAKGGLYIEDLVTPTLEYPHDRFPSPPDCYLDLDLKADGEGIGFGDSMGGCFHRTKADKPKLPIKNSNLSGLGLNLTRINLKGQASFDEKKGLDLLIDSNELDLAIAQYYAQTPLKGLGAQKTRLKGPYDSLILTTQLKAAETLVMGLDFGQVEGGVRLPLSENKLTLNQFKAVPDSGGSITLEKGELAISEPYAFSVHLEASELNEGFMKEWLEESPKESPPSAQITLIKGNLSGDLLKPLRYQGSLSLEAKEGLWGKETLFSMISGHLNLGPKGITTKDFLYELGGMRTLLTGTYQLAKNGRSGPDLLRILGGSLEDYLELMIQSAERKSLRRDDLILIPFLGKDLVPLELEGQLSVDAKVKGPLKKLNGEFRLDTAQLYLMKNPISPFQVKGTLDEGILNLEQINQGGDSFVGQMSIDIGRNNLPYQWDFKFHQFDIRTLGSAFFFKDPRNYAYLTANWQMAGSLTDWWNSEGKAQIDQIAIKMIRDTNQGWKSFSLENKEPTTVIFAKEGWTFADQKPFELKGTDFELSISTLENSPPERLQVVTEGKFDSAILRHFIPKLDASKGDVYLKGMIHGSVQEPILEFALENDSDPIQGVSLNFTPWPPPLEQIRFRLSYRNGKFLVEKLRGKKGTAGKIKAQGELFFDATSESSSNVNINFEKVELRRLPLAIFLFDTTASGDLVFTGNQVPFNLAGRIQVDRAISTGNFDIRNQIIDNINKKKIALGQSMDQEFLTLDLQILANESIKIRNRNITATLSADLRLSGSEVKPNVVGQIEIVDGKFFYKRDFKIRRGMIMFVAATYPPDPKLDIIADVNVSQYTVTIAVSGYASDPKVDMTINPSVRPDGSPISKLDILLLLTQGSLPNNETNASNVSAQNQAKSEALNLAISQFEQPVERLFDLSGQTVVRQVYFDTTANADGKPVPRINVPFHFTDDINVILQVDNESNVKVSSEYAVHESISFNVSLDKRQETEETIDETDRDSGVDLKFRFRFP